MDKEFKKKKMELLAHLNSEFIKSLENVIVPFFNNLHKIHLNNIDLNESEKKRIMDSITLTMYFSKKEAAIENDIYEYIKNGGEKVILDCINREVAIVQKIATDAEKGKYDVLYAECQALLEDLISLEKGLDRALSGQMAA